MGVVRTDRCGELLHPLPAFVFKHIFQASWWRKNGTRTIHLAEPLCNHFMEYSAATGPLPPAGTRELLRAGIVSWKTLERVPPMDP